MNARIVYAYSRSQAVADGVQVEVTRLRIFFWPRAGPNPAVQILVPRLRPAQRIGIQGRGQSHEREIPGHNELIEPRQVAENGSDRERIRLFARREQRKFGRKTVATLTGFEPVLPP